VVRWAYPPTPFGTPAGILRAPLWGLLRLAAPAVAAAVRREVALKG